MASLSASFATESLAVADAYAGALANGSPESWTAFVAAAAMVAGHSASVAAILHLTDREQTAFDYFAQIVRENDDLLAGDIGSAA